MFEKSLTDKFKRIFDLKKISFNMPGESQEQECLFIEVTQANTTVKDGRQVAKVTGKATVFCNSDKMPFGYFAQRIGKAKPDDTRDFFFFNIEESAPTFENIMQRTFQFVYLFDGQYDPDLGNMTSLITVET